MRTGVPVDESLHRLDTDTGRRQSRGVRPPAWIQVLVREFLPRDAELGDELTDVPGSQTHRHNSFQASPLPHCAIGEWWWVPHWQAASQQAGNTWCSHEHRPVVGYSSRLTKGIMVISKYFWSLYKLSVIMVALSKLESRAKGTFMLECRRFTNS